MDDANSRHPHVKADGSSVRASDAGRRDALLARVAIRPSEDEWAAWLRQCPDLEGLSPTELRLLPLVWTQLAAAGVALSPDLAGRLKGLHRKMWYHNKVRLQWAGAVQQRLAEAGIDALIFKGMQLLDLWGWDPGTRPTRDVDVWVRPGQFDWALGLMKSWPSMTVKATDLHSTTFTFDGVHSLDLHRMPHHLGGRVDNDRRFDAAFAQPGDRTQAMALLLANAFVNDAPDQFVGLYTLVDWHRSGVAWSAVEPMIAAEGLRPVVAAHLAQFPSVVAASPLLKDAELALQDRKRWTPAERAMAAAIEEWRRVRASDPPWTFHHWRWALQGVPLWRRDLRSVRDMLAQARAEGVSPLPFILHYRSRRRKQRPCRG